MIFDTSTVMSRTDKMPASCVVHLVFDQTIKATSKNNKVLHSRNEQLPKKHFWKVVTTIYTDLNHIF